MLKASLTLILATVGLAAAVLLTPAARAGVSVAHTTTEGSATNPDGTSGAPEVTVAPSLDRTGAVRVGTRLSCQVGEWANDPSSYRIRWRRGRRLVHSGGAYTVTRADAGSVLSVYVTAVNAQGPSAPAAGGRVRVAGTGPR